MALVLDRISQEADRILSPAMAEEYKRALLDEDSIMVTDQGISIHPASPMARRIESGYGPFDIKPGMLKGRSYVDVPFRYGITKGTRFHGLPSSVKAKIQTLMARKQAIQGKQPLPHVRLHKSGLKANPDHKAAQFDGLKHSERGYQTFRRISQKSPPASWWHPGFGGVQLFTKVAMELKPDIVAILKDHLRSAGLKIKEPL